MPNWSQKRRPSAYLREASQRDKAMRSMHQFPSENDSFRFSIIVWLLYCLQSTGTAVVLYRYKLSDADSLILLRILKTS